MTVLSSIITGLLVAQPYVLPLAIVLPTIVIILSFRLNFQVQASFLLYIFLTGSFLTAVSGVGCLSRHVWNIPDKMETLLGQTQDFARTILSTTSTAIFLVKFLSKAQASRETVNNVGIGFFILMIFAKFCSVTILPDVKLYSFQETQQDLTFEMFEILEFFIDTICCISTSVFVMITCNRADDQLTLLQPQVSNDDSLPVRAPLNLPVFPVMVVTRVFLLFSLQYQIMFAEDAVKINIIQDTFVNIHALLLPLLFLMTNTNMRTQIIKILVRRQEASTDHQLETFVGSETDQFDGRTLEHKRASSAPTRPSSALMPALPGGVPPDSSVRIPYRSNIRCVDLMLIWSFKT